MNKKNNFTASTVYLIITNELLMTPPLNAKRQFKTIQ